MQKYDLTVMLKSGAKDGAQDEYVKKLESTVVAMKGKTGRLNELGKKQLAYPVKKVNEAVFLSWELELPSEGVVELSKKLTIDREILRHLLVKLD